MFKGNERPQSLYVIDNHSDSTTGTINKAYMVYEIVVEGGETRLMALFKGQDFLIKLDQLEVQDIICLDYAMENDAIYVHFGQSPQAQSDIKKYSINDI